MIPLKFVPPPLIPAALWANAMYLGMQMMTASAQVIGTRTQMMLKAGPLPSSSERAEFTLMGTEKVGAFADAGGRAINAAMDLNQQWAKMWLGMLAHPTAHKRNLDQWMALSSATARASANVMQPIHRKATANARRLSRPSRKR